MKGFDAERDFGGCFICLSWYEGGNTTGIYYKNAAQVLKDV